MNRLGTTVTIAVIALGLVLSVSPSEAVVPSAPAVAATAARGYSPDHFTPASGATFNDPLGSHDSQRRSYRKIYRTIQSVPSGGKIRIASWNVRAVGLVNAMIRAHRRGVSVQVVMDRVNTPPTTANRDYTRLKSALRYHNAGRRAGMHSWIRPCASACRGPKGIAHTKFYLFSSAGKAHDIVMWGSTNATDLAATIQWNDLYTLVGARRYYSDFSAIFRQMGRRHNVNPPFRSFSHVNRTVSFYPNQGPGTTPDPVMTVLNRVRCGGAAAGVGIGGHTKIRIGQTATYGNRGLVLARKLASLQHQGCNIRLAYAMFGNNVLKILRAAGVPLVHVAVDTNADGLYDKYIHMKSMTIQGNYDGKPNAQITWNGSANWTTVALNSDEVVGEIVGAGVTRKYADWLSNLYNHPPFGRYARVNTEAIAAARGVNPYALMQLD